MARPLRLQFEGAIYHITARGNERKKIFFSKTDYERFLKYLAEAKKKFHINLLCYVLMSNHYHLIIETLEANLSRALHYINSSYSTYINVKRKRSGHLFQGRYKSIVVDRDNYLLELSRYIHLNPVRAKMVEKPEDYPHSSYSAYISKRGTNKIVKKDVILELVARQNGKGGEEYKRFVDSAIKIDLDDPMKDVYGGIILGGVSFIKATLRTINEEYHRKDEVSNRRALRTTCGMEEIVEAVSNFFNVTDEEIKGTKFSKLRNIAIYLIKEKTGTTNREIGELFGGLSHSAVAKIYRKTKEGIKGDIKLRRQLSQIQINLDNFKG